MNMIIHDDGHTNVVATDGLFPSEELIRRTNNQGFTYNRFDFIITNPPFGSVIKQTEQAYLREYGFAMKAEDWLNPKSRVTPRESQSTEILFIEQCHRFLREGGYLAIVVPDGILTNSSLQYVRDGIEEKFRIVGVVSMPQTAFQATGAGVKSSVLFLRKHATETTDKICQGKQLLQDDLLRKKRFSEMLVTWEDEKKAALKALKKSAVDFESQKKAINEEYSEKLNALKEELEESYQADKQKKLLDYPIFMAIAENIGYDATGKTIPQNDLPEITAELSRFIEAIETGQDSFFV
jgi:type I restriction-modification system DNA methylase subunit